MAADGPVKRRGRPREFDGPPVSVRLPQTLYNDLSLAAIRQGRELSHVIRERLERPNSVSQNVRGPNSTAQS